MLHSIHCVLNPICYHPKLSTPATLQPILSPPNQDSCINPHYLVKRFGFSKEKALSSSRYLKTGRNPELVREFLQNQGLTDEQIGTIVRYDPTILLTDPAKTLGPKVEFFVSLGISQEEVNNILLTAPDVFGRSLTEQIIPTLSYVKDLFESSGTDLCFGKRLGGILSCPLEKYLIPNVETLRKAGVADSNIAYLLQHHPLAIRVDNERFRKVVDEVRRMKICPSKLKFIHAVIAFRSMTKTTWDTKVEAYKEWGWSEDDVVLAFQRHPGCMTISADKVSKFMDFMVNEMGFESSAILKNPGLIGLSLEKRVKPRCRVYNFLVENGLIKRGSYLSSILASSEEKFLDRFVYQHETHVREILRVYHDKGDESK